MVKFVDMTGRRFGKLLVLDGNRRDRAKNGWVIHKCLVRCDCQFATEKLVRYHDLRSGKVLSCGCLHKEGLVSRNTKHGGSTRERRNPVYSVWSNMRRRCYDSSNIGYRNYGGRGITVCERWKNSFANFYVDMGDKPSPKHSLGRVDNDSNYEPNNCRWETHTQQKRNTRRTMLSEEDIPKIRNSYSKSEATIGGLAQHYGVSPGCIWAVVFNRSWKDIS